MISNLFFQVVKKLSGEGKATAEWFTSISNEYSQTVSFVLTCAESVEDLKPMVDGVIKRYEDAEQPEPSILYIDKGWFKYILCLIISFSILYFTNLSPGR